MARSPHNGASSAAVCDRNRGILVGGALRNGWLGQVRIKLKTTNPSYTDVYELLKIATPDDDDLVAKIKRLSDNKIFHFRLSWLRTLKNKEPVYTLLNDYSVWHITHANNNIINETINTLL